MQLTLSSFVKQERKKLGLSQLELAQKAGVGIHFIRDLEQGRQNLQMAKVNTVLALFGFTLGPQPIL